MPPNNMDDCVRYDGRGDRPTLRSRGSKEVSLARNKPLLALLSALSDFVSDNAKFEWFTDACCITFH